MSYKVQYFSPIFENWSDSGNPGLQSVVFNTIQDAQDAIEEHGSKAIEYKAVYNGSTAGQKLGRIKEILDEPSKSERIMAILEEV